MIDTVAFPGTPATAVDAFWSSSPYVGRASYAWVVNFSLGYVYNDRRSSVFYVRLVRADQ